MSRDKLIKSVQDQVCALDKDVTIEVTITCDPINGDKAVIRWER